jgi:hypothetical protein
MIFTGELLNRLEGNTELKKAHAAEGSLGRNRLVILPVVVGFIAAFVAYFFYDMGKTDPTYRTYAIVCGVLILICLVALIVIQANSKKQVLANLNEVTVCVAKKIYGNDRTGSYYSIYTTGNKRHDADFIEVIADKIFKINEEPDSSIRAEIDKLFREDFEGTHVAPVQLPIAFTYGEAVFRKEFNLSSLQPDMRQSLIENNDKFIVLAFKNSNTVLLKSLSTLL